MELTNYEIIKILVDRTSMGEVINLLVCYCEEKQRTLLSQKKSKVWGEIKVLLLGTLKKAGAK